MKNRNLVHKDDWKTPEYILERLRKEFGSMFDPCPLNHDMDWDGLKIEWEEVNLINPPHSRKLKEEFIKTSGKKTDVTWWGHPAAQKGSVLHREPFCAAECPHTHRNISR